MRFIFWGSIIAGVAGLVSPALCDVTTGTFHGLGFLSGGNVSDIAGISQNGEFVIGSSQSSSGLRAFIWSQSTGMVSLGAFPNGATDGGPWGVSNDGSVVVGEFGADDAAFRWTAATGIQNIGSLDGQAFNRAFAVSADGSTIYGDADSNSGRQAFRWTQSTGMVGLGYPTNYALTIALATSADGSVAVGEAQRTSGAISAFRWTAAGGFQILGNTTIATGISADGSTIVGATLTGSPANDQAFRWTATGGTKLLTLPAGYTNADAQTVSADGSIIAGTVGNATTDTGFVWDAVDGMRDIKSVLLSYNLDVASWTFDDAWVAGDGITFGGTAVDPSGNTEAWVAVLPEPNLATTVIIASGIVTMCRRRIRPIQSTSVAM